MRASATTGEQMTTKQESPALLLSSVRLERFKAAFETDEVELHPFTILIGRNGSGKSTLLEALQWIDTSVRFDARRACERYYGIRDLVNLRSRASHLLSADGKMEVC